MMLCRALLEVQPVLADLASPPPPPASSSGSDSDSDCEQEAAAAAPADAQPGAAASGGSGAAAAAAAAIGVHLTQDACGSSGWRRLLVHLTGQHGRDGAGCSSADEQRAAQVVAVAEQVAAACRRCGGAAGSVCSLRCWYAIDGPAGGSQSNLAWQASLVSSAQKCTGQPELVMQSVQVSRIATSVQPGPCWAVMEVYVAP